MKCVHKPVIDYRTGFTICKRCGMELNSFVVEKSKRVDFASTRERARMNPYAHKSGTERLSLQKHATRAKRCKSFLTVEERRHYNLRNFFLYIHERIGITWFTYSDVMRTYIKVVKDAKKDGKGSITHSELFMYVLITQTKRFSKILRRIYEEYYEKKFRIFQIAKMYGKYIRFDRSDPLQNAPLILSGLFEMIPLYREAYSDYEGYILRCIHDICGSISQNPLEYGLRYTTNTICGCLYLIINDDLVKKHGLPPLTYTVLVQLKWTESTVRAHYHAISRFLKKRRIKIGNSKY